MGVKKTNVFPVDGSVMEMMIVKMVLMKRMNFVLPESAARMSSGRYRVSKNI